MNKIGVYVILGIECFLSMCNFLIALTLFIVFFGGLGYAIHYAQMDDISLEERERFVDLDGGILFGWQMLMGENIAAEYEYDDPAMGTRWFFYLFFVIIMNIIVLNLVIAVTGDVYEEAMYSMKTKELIARLHLTT